MKLKNLFSCLLVMSFTATPLFAENPVAKGKILVDADFSLTSEKADLADDWDTKVDNTNYLYDFRLGYAVIDNLEIGVGLTSKYSIQEVANPYVNTEEGSDYKYFNLFARQYFMPDSKLRPFLQAVVGIGNLNKVQTGEEDQKYNLTHFCAGTGIAYFANDSIGIEFCAQYERESGKDDDLHDQSNDFTSNALSLNLGMIYSF